MKIDGQTKLKQISRNTVLYWYSSLTDQGKYRRVTKVRSRDYDIMNFAPHKDFTC